MKISNHDFLEKLAKKALEKANEMDVDEPHKERLRLVKTSINQ